MRQSEGAKRPSGDPSDRENFWRFVYENDVILHAKCHNRVFCLFVFFLSFFPVFFSRLFLSFSSPFSSFPFFSFFPFKIIGGATAPPAPPPWRRHCVEVPPPPGLSALLTLAPLGRFPAPDTVHQHGSQTGMLPISSILSILVFILGLVFTAFVFSALIWIYKYQWHIMILAFHFIAERNVLTFGNFCVFFTEEL